MEKSKEMGIWDKATLDAGDKKIPMYRLLDMSGKPKKIFLRNRDNIWEEYDPAELVKRLKEEK